MVTNETRYNPEINREGSLRFSYDTPQKPPVQLILSSEHGKPWVTIKTSNDSSFYFLEEKQNWPLTELTAVACENVPVSGLFTARWISFCSLGNWEDITTVQSTQVCRMWSCLAVPCQYVKSKVAEADIFPHEKSFEVKCGFVKLLLIDWPWQGVQVWGHYKGNWDNGSRVLSYPSTAAGIIFLISLVRASSHVFQSVEQRGGERRNTKSRNYHFFSMLLRKTADLHPLGFWLACWDADPLFLNPHHEFAVQSKG